MAILQVAPPGRCWSCAAPTEGWNTLCPWCGEDVREPLPDVPDVPDVPEEGVRTHGQLTVIQGSAPREAAVRSEARDDGRRAPAARPATVTNLPPVSDQRVADLGPRERRIDLGSPPPLGEQARRAPAAAAAAASASASASASAAASASASVEAATDPVRRLKASLGRSTQSLGAAAALVVAPAAERAPVAEPRSLVIASAIYVTGSRGLQAGSRYGIAVSGDELQILGPVDVDPSAVAIAHALRGMDATGLQGRLIITATDGRRDQLALVFMSVAGGSPEGVADAIIAAARGSRADLR